MQCLDKALKISSLLQVEGSNNFIISNGGGTQTFHLRAINESDKQRWLQALDLSKARSMRAVAVGEAEADEDGFDSSDNDPPQEISKQELVTTVKSLTAKMEDLSTCSDLVAKHGTGLITSLNALKLDKILVSWSIDIFAEKNIILYLVSLGIRSS